MLSSGNLTIGYSDKRRTNLLQKNLNLELHQGTFVCLIGPNGCGKSTLIRVLGGLQLPLAGWVKLGENEVRKLSGQEKSRHISMVLTDRSSVDNITVEEVVALGRYGYTNWIGRLTGKDQQYIAAAIEKTGLSGFENRMLATLSDGERQRTFIGKAVASNAPLMLLDEPTAHLDIPNKVEIMSLLKSLTMRSEHTCLVSTHDLELALQMADMIWLMIPGKGMVCLTPDELKQRNYLNEVFGNKTVFFNNETGTFNLKSV